MNYEVEMKFRAVDHDQVVERLQELGAAGSPRLQQVDVYLSHPARDFAQTGEAFRLRRSGEDNQLTYKGPRHEGPTKTREELEIPYQPGEAAFLRMQRLMTHLGFRPVATIRKQRESFHLEFEGSRLEIALDTAEGLGTFVEVETIAAGPENLRGAQQAVLALSERLGLTEIEPRSYLRMSLEASARGASGS